MLRLPHEDVSVQPLSAVPQFWTHQYSYSYLDAPRPEDALLLFLPEESGCRFTLKDLDGRCFHPAQGDIFYTPKGSRFVLCTENPDNPLINRSAAPRIVTNLCIKFQVLDSAGAVVPLGGSGLLRPTDETARQCHRLMHRLAHIYLNVHDSQFLMKSKMYELLYLLSENENAADADAPQEALSPVLQYMRQNLSAQINVPALADLCHMSQAAFYRAFKARTGASPKQYWLDMRIAKAKEMLDDPLLSVADVAFYLGYFDVAHFCKQFRASAGITPHRYRLRSR